MQHHIINVEQSKNSKQALAAHVKRKGKGRPKQQAKGDNKALSVDSEITCFNCGGKGHKKPDCWSEGGGKEGQGPHQRKGKKTDSETAVVAAENDKDNELFAFTCTSNLANVAEALQIPKS